MATPPPTPPVPPVPRVAPTGVSSGDPGAHIGDMHGSVDTNVPSRSTRDKVVRVSVELFGVAETAEILAYAANLATRDDLAGLRSELKDAMRNQAIALISATAALQLATIGVVASLVR